MVGDHPLDHVAQRAVVDGVAEVVARAGRGQVEVEVEVDLERLGLGLLVGQHADDAGQRAGRAARSGLPAATGYFGTVAARATRSRPSGPSWRDSSRSTTDVACGAIGTTSAHSR